MSQQFEIIKSLKDKNFIQAIILNHGEVFLVGGATRDLILNKPSKDIDLIVRKISINTLISLLSAFGKVDIVGKSFGVLKFVDNDEIDYDIALPRREKSNGEGGYHGFEIQSDCNLNIEDDLIRRDVKFNAMAINIKTGEFIDPLGGLKDIENKEISAANPEAFSDDPLRMLRVVSFASRFKFSIEPVTLKMIQKNASRIKEISSERILIEFEKIVNKGDMFEAAFLLKLTGLMKNIFDKDSGLFVSEHVWNNMKTMGEFIYIISHNLVDNPAEFYKNNLKGDINTYKEIKALEIAFNEDNSNARHIVHKMYMIFPSSINSLIISPSLIKASNEFNDGLYPKTVNELAIKGEDLIKLGYKGKEIGDMQKLILNEIYSDKLKNKKRAIMRYLRMIVTK